MKRKILSTLLLSSFLTISAGFNSLVFAKEMLPANTPVTVKPVRLIGQDTSQTGDKVSFTVANDVIKNGKTIIKANTPAYGTITQLQEYKRIGRPGSMTIENVYTNAVDGTVIKLTDLNEIPKSKMKKSIALSVVIIPLFLLMRGAKAEIAPESTRTLHTLSDTYVNL